MINKFFTEINFIAIGLLLKVETKSEAVETDFNVSYENCHSELLSFEFLYKSQIGSLLALDRIRNRFENYISLVFPFVEGILHAEMVYLLKRIVS